MSQTHLTRRRALQMVSAAAIAAIPMRHLLGADVKILQTPGSSGLGLAKLQPFVQPGMNWSGAELNEFLEELPPQALLSLKQALGLLGPDATTDSLKGTTKDVEEFEKELLWVSSDILEYPFHDRKKIYYHEMVKWVAASADVDPWIIDTQPTLLIERACVEQMFSNIWHRLNAKQRDELLTKIDKTGAIKDRAAIISLSGSGALAALATTELFAGFTFYTTISVTLCAVAGWFGVTLPFAAYTSTSSLIGFLCGPIGWALLAVALAAGVTLAGRADVKKTAAAIFQIHMLKAAALQDAGKSDELFQSLGDPLKRQLVGKWSWRASDRAIELDLKSDGSFTSSEHPDKQPRLLDGGGLISSGKGDWRVHDGKLTVAKTRVWEVAFWKQQEITWIDGQPIIGVTPTEIALREDPPLKRQ